MSYKRYTEEFRGGDYNEKPWEWRVIDEDLGFNGCAILFDLTEEEEAIAKAKELYDAYVKQNERKALEHLHLALLLTINKGAMYNIIAAKSWISADLASRNIKLD